MGVRESRVHALDGVRTVAVLLVFLSHSVGDLVPGGFVGVDIFFALSGYLISTLLVREWQTHGEIALRAFYVRRLLRLYPALLLTLVGVAAITPVIGYGWRYYTIDAATALTYTYNFWLLAPPGTLIGHFWSLCVEEQYYLLWPPFVIWLLRRGERAAIRGTALGICLTFAVQVALVPILGGEQLYFLPVGHANELLIGSLFGLVLATRPAVGLRRVLRSHLAWLAWVPIAAVALFGERIQDAWLYFGGLAVLAVCSCIIVGHLALKAESSPMGRLLRLRPLVWLGVRSYAFYLVHQPVIELLRHFGLPYRVLLPLALAITIAIIGLSFRYLERPMLERYKRPREKSALVPGAAGSVP